MSFSFSGYSTTSVTDDHIGAYVSSLINEGNMTVKLNKVSSSTNLKEHSLPKLMVYLTCFARKRAFSITMNITTLQESPLVIHIEIDACGLDGRDDVFNNVYGFSTAFFQILGITLPPSQEQEVKYVDENLICTAENPCAVCVADGIKAVICTDEYPCEDCGGKNSPPPLRRT